MVEGAPLLREYRVKSLIEGSNPSLSAKKMASLGVIFLPGHARDERFSETTYEVVIRLDGGGYTMVQRADGASFRVGDRVRVRGTQLELLAP